MTKKELCFPMVEKAEETLDVRKEQIKFQSQQI